jgi:hypothetical protein
MMALEHSAEVDTIICRVDEGIAHCSGVIWNTGRSTTYVSSWRLLSIFNSAEGSANNAIAIELLVSRFQSSYSTFAWVARVRRQKRSIEARMSSADLVH